MSGLGHADRIGLDHLADRLDRGANHDARICQCREGRRLPAGTDAQFVRSVSSNNSHDPKVLHIVVVSKQHRPPPRSPYYSSHPEDSIPCCSLSHCRTEWRLWRSCIYVSMDQPWAISAFTGDRFLTCLSWFSAPFPVVLRLVVAHSFKKTFLFRSARGRCPEAAPGHGVFVIFD